MSIFKEHLKLERRNLTLNFIKKYFGFSYQNFNWNIIKFWLFLILTLFVLYKTLTFENKFPVECGKIVNCEKIQCNSCNKTFKYHIFIKNNKGILEDLIVGGDVYGKYEKLWQIHKNVEYCESFTDKNYIFLIIIIILFTITTIIYGFKLIL